MVGFKFTDKDGATTCLGDCNSLTDSSLTREPRTMSGPIVGLKFEKFRIFNQLTI